MDGVSFECRAGEIFGLLGANGAGKTTTLRILATILKPSAGSASVMGHDVLAEPEAVRASLGFSSSTTALYPRLTARETLDFFARINGCSEGAGPRARGAAHPAIRDPGIRRRARGQAVAGDEAEGGHRANGGARPAGADLRRADRRARRAQRAGDAEDDRGVPGRGKAIIFSTHIMSEAEKLCDRIAIIHRGKIHACDTLAGFARQHRPALPGGHFCARRPGRRRRGGSAGARRSDPVKLRSPIVFTLFRTELRMLLRDRRVLLTSLVLPMLITPLLMLGSKATVERHEKTLREMTYRYAVTGPEAASVRELVRAARARIDSKSKTNQHPVPVR